MTGHLKQAGGVMAALALSLAVASPPLAARAADTGGSRSTAAAAPATAPLDAARAEIDAGRYAQALRLLAAIVRKEPRNADALNLMGYANRKMDRPAEAQRWYEAALKADPRHAGALEYQGELFLELGDLDRARQNLNLLRASCGNCAEYQDLARAIATSQQG